MNIENKTISMIFHGRKFFIKTCKLNKSDFKLLAYHDFLSPEPFIPKHNLN